MDSEEREALASVVQESRRLAEDRGPDAQESLEALLSDLVVIGCPVPTS